MECGLRWFDQPNILVQAAQIQVEAYDSQEVDGMPILGDGHQSIFIRIDIFYTCAYIYIYNIYIWYYIRYYPSKLLI